MITNELIFFEEYLRGADFQSNLSNLARAFRQKVFLDRPIEELGLVCPDVVAAVKHLEQTYKNMGPFLVAEGSTKEFSENGQPVAYKTRVAFGFYKGVLLELAEPGSGSEIFATHLDKEGSNITIHHIGFIVKGEQLKDQKKNYLQIMQSCGYTPWVEATVGIFGTRTLVAIFPTEGETNGLSTEFIRFKILGLEIPFLLKYAIKLVANFQKWFGPPIIKIA